jgi:subtilisin family serine protease
MRQGETGMTRQAFVPPQRKPNTTKKKVAVTKKPKAAKARAAKVAKKPAKRAVKKASKVAKPKKKVSARPATKKAAGAAKRVVPKRAKRKAPRKKQFARASHAASYAGVARMIPREDMERFFAIPRVRTPTPRRARPEVVEIVGPSLPRSRELDQMIAALDPQTAVAPASDNALMAPPRPLASTLAQLSTKLSVVPATTTLRALTPVELNVSPEMDPRLQVALANFRTGKRSLAMSSATGTEVPVMARVRDLAAWEADPDVLHGARLGMLADGTELVSGRVPIDRAEAVRAQEWVVSLKGSQPIVPSLQQTVDTMHVASGALPSGVKPQGGKGVVVGIVDFGGDFVHPNFRTKQNKTRLLALWNQGDVPRADPRVDYGRLYTREEIDAALATSDPYGALRYTPEFEAHGTHVMDIAAGNGRGTSVSGVAPDADLVFVELSANDVPWRGPETTKHHFGDSVQMVEAVKFIFDLAGERPCVVNLSLGTNGGPHDGSSLVEQSIDALVRERPGRAVVIAASNSQNDGIHIDGVVPAGGDFDIEWRVLHQGGEFELWYGGEAALEASLIAPDGSVVMTVSPGANEALASGGQVAIFGSNRQSDPNNGSHVIAIWLAPGLDSGIWKVRLSSTNQQPAPFHAWVERLDGAQSSFVSPVPTHTLGSISTGHESIVVGSYDAHVPSFPLSTFSSCGPTRDGRRKPEISAPGHQVLAACSREPTGVVRMSGTSMAAPAVSGLIALMLAEARRNGATLTIADIRRKLQTQADGQPPASGGWDPRYGAGRASGRAVG